jgi:hemolysin III
MYAGERFNSISHLVGSALAIIGTAALVTIAAERHDPWEIVAFSIYGTMLILLYVMSTLYHSLRGRAKEIFHKLDHIGIFLLIAGTYTPFTLVTLRGTWGWTLFGVVWSLAIIGIVQDLWFKQRVLKVVLSLIMGWLIIFATKPLLAAMPAAGMWWLAIGGIFYSVGVIFFALSKKWQPAHAVWHVFVMLGSISHFVSVAGYVGRS